MKSTRMFVSGILIAAAMAGAAVPKITVTRKDAPSATRVKVVKGTDNGGCKGPVWESNGNGASEGWNCPKGKMCCETLIAGSRGKVVEFSKR